MARQKGSKRKQEAKQRAREQYTRQQLECRCERPLRSGARCVKCGKRIQEG